jgi:hypothetical protein
MPRITHQAKCSIAARIHGHPSQHYVATRTDFALIRQLKPPYSHITWMATYHGICSAEHIRRDRYGAGLAVGVACTARPHGALSRGSPHRHDRAAEPDGPCGSHGGLAGRWRVRWHGAAGHAERTGRVRRLPDGDAHDGDVGGRDLSPRDVRRVSPAWETAGVARGLWDPRGVGPDAGAVLVGPGRARARVSGQPSGDSRGGLPLGSQAVPHRDLFRGPDKSRLPYAAGPYRRPTASLAGIHRRVLSLYLACLLRGIGCSSGRARADASAEAL